MLASSHPMGGPARQIPTSQALGQAPFRSTHQLPVSCEALTSYYLSWKISIVSNKSQLTAAAQHPWSGPNSRHA